MKDQLTADQRVPTLDEQLGIAWWNRISHRERRKWLDRAKSAVPADAWRTFKAETAR